MWLCPVVCGLSLWCVFLILTRPAKLCLLNPAFVPALPAPLGLAWPQRRLAGLDATFHPPLDCGLETSFQSLGESEAGLGAFSRGPGYMPSTRIISLIFPPAV